MGEGGSRPQDRSAHRSGSRDAREAPPGADLRPRVHRRRQIGLQRLFRSLAAADPGRRCHPGRQRVVEGRGHQSADRRRRHRSDPKIQRPRGRRLPRRMRDAADRGWFDAAAETLTGITLGQKAPRTARVQPESHRDPDCSPRHRPNSRERRGASAAERGSDHSPDRSCDLRGPENRGGPARRESGGENRSWATPRRASHRQRPRVSANAAHRCGPRAPVRVRLRRPRAPARAGGEP